MKTIVFANQKGGAGKSTTTTHIAAAAEYCGDGPVVINDADPQGTTVDWFNDRKRGGIETPRFAPLNIDNIEHDKKALAKAGVRYLFIDTAPSVGGVNPLIFSAADVILIPLNPTPADMRSMVKGLPAIKKSGRPFYFILARVRPGLRNNNSVAMALESLGLVIPARMHERIIYAESFGHGKTAFELDPQGIAANEVLQIWEGVKTRILENEKSIKMENIA